ncbi:MAG: hypothetical protein ACN4GG_04785 [Akkermansiaceae bacterium]
MNEERKIQPLVPAWKLWANPIVRRYARSRLRPTALGVWALIYLMLAGFFFFLVRESIIGRGGQDAVDASRVAVIPLLVLQGIVLFMFGTGQAAGGMTAEADEGVIEYQRLAPMTPLAKVMGFLFGLTIREWVLFLILLPLSIFAFWHGQIPFFIGIQLYAVVIMAGILYHLTGLLAGTVMKNRRWAFLGSMGLVFMLYTVLPQVSKFGLAYFKYITILPVAEELASYFSPRRIGEVVELAQNYIPTARFFGLDFPQSLFTLFSQAVLILTMMVMLRRRWRKQESHLLGKVGAVGLFGWIQLVLLGNSIPLIETGTLFPSRELSRRFGRFSGERFADWTPEAEEMLVMLGAYGTVTLLMLWLMSFLITPGHEGLVRGWRRVRKKGEKRLSFLSDPATATPWVLMMAAMGAIGWGVFAKELVGSRWFPEYELPRGTFWMMAASLLAAGLIFQGILEWKGRKVTGLSVLLGGVFPLMVGVVLGASGDEFAAISVWLIGSFPAAWPFYAGNVMVPTHEMPLSVARAMPLAFCFWVGVGLCFSTWICLKLRAYRKVVASKCE